MTCTSRSLWWWAWQGCFTTQHQTCKTKTKTDFFLVSDRSCPKTAGLRPHHWCIVIGPVCGFVCLCVCGCVSFRVFYGVTTITRNCVHRSSPNSGFVGKGSDHLQLINVGRPAPTGRGSAAGRKFLALPYYSQRAVFSSLWVLFSFYWWTECKWK